MGGDDTKSKVAVTVISAAIIGGFVFSGASAYTFLRVAPSQRLVWALFVLTRTAILGLHFLETVYSPKLNKLEWFEACILLINAVVAFIMMSYVGWLEGWRNSTHGFGVNLLFWSVYLALLCNVWFSLRRGVRIIRTRVIGQHEPESGGK
jgi:hypothetical protein